MRDPHVKSLRYRLEIGKSVSYENPPPVEVDTHEFLIRLDKGILTCGLKEHYPSIEKARSVVEGFLRAWEIDAALISGRVEFNFVYENAEVIDRNPPPSDSIQIEVADTIITSEVSSVENHAIYPKYPDPPKLFTLTPDVETLWQRYEGYLQGKEPLPAIAYFCLTLVEHNAGGRKPAATVYNIEFDILDELGKLTSRGDEKTARKIKKGSTLIPLLPQEITWIEAAIKALIRRVGEYRPGVQLHKLKMADLPNL
jgi:hypothetical protein